MVSFICNVCGTGNRCPEQQLRREVASCHHCGSSVRTRGLVEMLSQELFGVSLLLPDFPRVKSLRGLGMSDPAQFADALSHRFDYRNTFFDREPRFDITRVAEQEYGQFDFIVSSEVLEHVRQPSLKAFQNVAKLLKPGGVLLLTVPYSLNPETVEHFPELCRYGLATVGDQTVLVNRTKEGCLQVFEDIVFHLGCGDPALEMRQFSEQGLRQLLVTAGFDEVKFHGGVHRAFGISQEETWSLPIAARKGPFTFSAAAARDVLVEWREYKLRFNAEMQRLNRSLWFRLGRRLRLL